MDDDEKLLIEVFENTGNVHIDHCARCHLSVCPFVDGFGCPIRKCIQCGVGMHECKVEEHLEEICSKTRIPCINSTNGCSHTVRRHRLQHHLLNCPANVVVCTREWGRKTISNESKLLLKAMAKRVVPTTDTGIPDDQLDLAAAHSDQRVILNSYQYRRRHRVGQRDMRHKAHPLVPLRAVYDHDGVLVFPGSHETTGDSSDEERETRAAKLRSKKAMFTNCYMCQVDPSSQHLHTLGNENTKYKLGRLVKKWPKPEDKFHSAHNLMIDVSPVTTFEDKHLLFRKTLYIRRCLRVFHRREIGDHELSQHQTGIDYVDQVVVRCPNWERGCDYWTSRLKPIEGRLRFLNELDAVVHSPEGESLSVEGSLLDQPAWVIQKIAEYLLGSSLYSLSLTSKSLRNILFVATEERQLVEIKWKKAKDGWIDDGLRYFYSMGDQPVKMRWEPAGGLSNHLFVCQFGPKKEYSENRVSVLLDRD